MFWNVRATRARLAMFVAGHALEQNRRLAPRRACAWRLPVRVSCLDLVDGRRRLAGQRQPTLGRFVEAGDAVEHRRLAGAVGADQRGDVAAPGLKRQFVDGGEPAKAHREILDDEDGIGLPAHQPCPSLTRSPDTDLRSFRKIEGARVETRPRGLPDHHDDHRRPEQQAAILRRVEIRLRLTPSSSSRVRAPSSGRADQYGRGDRDAELRTHAAEHHNGENGRQFDEGEAFRTDETLAHGEEGAGEAAEHRPERKRGELGVGRVDAERTAGDLVFAQRLPGAADRQTAQAQGDEIGQKRKRQDQIEKEDRAVDRRVGQMEERRETVFVVVERNAEEGDVRDARDARVAICEVTS